MTHLKDVPDKTAQAPERAKTERVCGRCEEKIGRSPSVVAEGAPYAGMHLHLHCAQALAVEDAPPEPHGCACHHVRPDGAGSDWHLTTCGI